MSDETALDRGQGIIAWMVQNRVTPNLMMVVLLLGGFFMARTIKQEVFPEFELDMINVNVVYPGAGPEEVEQGIILSIEEAVRGLDGISEVRATAGEGFASVTAELLEGADEQKVYQDFKQQIDRITTFPENAERPEVSMQTTRQQVLDVLLYGDATEWVLRESAEQIRDILLQKSGITQVELAGARRYEIHVQIDQETLRRYGLTIQQVADLIRHTSLELPGGYVETQGGDILLRVTERRDWAREFAGIPVISGPNGSVVYLKDIAHVVDGFEDTNRIACFNGMRAIGIEVYRVGRQTPIGVADAVRQAMKKVETQLPPGIQWTIQNDKSQIYRQHLELLLRNAFWGLCLVLILLGLFLEIRLAFWVTMGIPISFLGAFLFLPGMGVTINMISIFAFIITLGIVVDDAIVIGENIFEYHNRGMGLVRAAVLGTRDVFVPVIFSILTNIIAFLPLFMIPSWMGKIARVIPLVVITVFIISLAESLLILPCHLGHIRPRSKGRLSTWINAGQQAFSRGFIRFVEKIFAPFLDRCIQFRHITTAMGFAILITILAFVLSGRIGIILMPRIESDVAMVTAVLPYGSPMTRVEKIRDYLTDKAWEIVETHGGDELCEGVFADINENQVEVYMYLTDPDVRPLETSEVANLWRQKVGAVPGLESLRFEADTDAPGQGAALTVELSHRNIEMLDKASEKLSEILSNFTSIKDIDDGYSPGKPQLNFTIKPEGQSLGLTPMEIAHQVRHAFYGAEALRQQRGRNEIRVMVKLPKEQRISEYDVEQLLIRTPAGTDVPLMEVAEVNWGRAYNLIDREDGRRSVEVTANIEPIEDTSRVLAALEKEVFPQMLKQFPGLACDWDGSQEELSEGVQTLISGFAIAMFMIFAMLAIPFRSYIQPVIVMVAVPFGIVGAVLGHLIMGYALSLMSIMGIVALSGVVVNDSLVLISYANEQRRQGFSAFEAIHKAGIRRFRPIILTTLTTFGGLTPMIMESSVQGRFLIPMAISLGFGILFSTSITLILVPCFYMMIDDVQRLWKQTANVIQPV